MAATDVPASEKTKAMMDTTSEGEGRRRMKAPPR
jgi:hypothetical protein